MTEPPYADDQESDASDDGTSTPERHGGPTPIPRGFETTGPPLGAGATAVVWPVRRLVDGREFALKVWRRPFSDANERERFRREVRQHADLNRVSGHVVTYAWSEEDPADGTPWIGTEQHGTSLQDVLEGGRPPLVEALRLGADLLQGLADMHSRDTLHRDVKPANVLVHEGRAMLCDLGLVMDAAAYTDDNAAGTPLFVAPELLAGVSPPSARTDVYSAARTLRELLGPNLPPALEQLLTAAASVNPADRPQDAAAFVTAYRRLCADLGEQLPPPMPPPRSRTAPAVSAVSAASAAAPAGGFRRRAVWLGAGLAAMAAVIAGVLFLPDRDGAAGPIDAAGPATPAASASLVPLVASSVDPGRLTPNAGQARPDITSDGRPVVLLATTAGQCDVAVKGADLIDRRPYKVDGVVVGEVYVYYSEAKRQGCAKLVKPPNSPLRGVNSHLAVTLCGTANACDYDWNAYSIDAGPVIVPSFNGCLSYRVSMLDEASDDWLIRDQIGWVGCN